MKGIRIVTVATIEKRIAEIKKEMDKHSEDEKAWKLLEARRDELRKLIEGVL